MPSPLWAYPGVWQGRIVPQHSIPQSPASSSYYYAYYYGYGYSDNEYVFCLGTDRDPAPIHRLDVGDSIVVEQQFIVPAGSKLLRFCWHMRIPDNLPVARTITAGKRVDFKTSNLLRAAGDGCAGIILYNPNSLLQSTDQEQVATISGATDAANNGNFPIIAVPSAQSRFDSITGLTVGTDSFIEGTRAVINNPSLVARDNDPNVTIVTNALYWLAQVLIDCNDGLGFVERASLVEQVDHTYYRRELAVNLARFVGHLSLRFALTLVGP